MTRRVRGQSFGRGGGDSVFEEFPAEVGRPRSAGRTDPRDHGLFRRAAGTSIIADDSADE
ncbi:hypothetical protein [Nocardia cyriacigeorgica]|uniref:hypothetical protein n=1 Tax=Nocardia cyriacigeorgica TaxID=135487 RepID=UPI001107D860|nr:hypothetical protein [Nocardia cyriacigeorgica]